MTLSWRAVAAEAFGTTALLAAVVGSGVMAERLSPHNAGVALLANALATGSALYVLVTMLTPVSSAHLNPAVSLVAWLSRDITGRVAITYVAAQIAGAMAGVVLAHAMFGIDLLQIGVKGRSGPSQWLSEAVATGGLMLVIAGFVRHARPQLPAAVAAYITAAYWFTASTSFANPAVTVARAATATFSGIAVSDAPAFVASQLVGATLAWTFGRWLFAPGSQALSHSFTPLSRNRHPPSR